jgi:hypothetical protein
MTIAEALLDQRALAGIGNVFKSGGAVPKAASSRSPRVVHAPRRSSVGAGAIAQP